MDWQPPDKPAVTLADSELAAMSKNERIKAESEGLFYVSEKGEVHTFRDELDAMSGGEAETIGNAAKELSKFFGIYKQQVRGERGRKTTDFIFMIRIKNPGGGALSPQQWCALDDAAEQFADGTLRLTSRQAIQYHYVRGAKLAPLMRHLNRHYRDGGTLAACGDVNRNVMCSPIDGLDPGARSGGLELAEAIAEELAPKTSAYFQIFLSDEDGHRVKPMTPDEPLYGKQYLPRKFKVGIASSRDNNVDVLTQDVGFVPAAEDGSLWDLYSGGGMGLSHNNPGTAALLGLHLGRVRRDQAVAATRAIALLQKENGERKDRRQARWKYTIRRMGLDAVRKALRERFAIDLADTEPIPVPPMELHTGWHDQIDGRSWYGLSIENGRVKGAMRKAIREAVETLGLTVRLTGQQDLLLCDVEDRAALTAILERHGAALPETISLARANAMACPAKPTCGLAMTDAENILPEYMDAIEAAGLGDVDVVIRMTGCPNNCARPPSAEIGIYGYGKNDHVVLVGGARNGTRIARTLYPRLSGEQMAPALVGLLAAIKQHNPRNLPAGDFLAETDPGQLRDWIGIGEGS